jgi:hypothetical protein
MTDYLCTYIRDDEQIARLVRYYFGIKYWTAEDVRSRRGRLPKHAGRGIGEESMGMQRCDAAQGSAALLKVLARFFLKYDHIRTSLTPSEIEYYRRLS